MDKITIYSDGSCRNNQSRENIGSWAFRLEHRNKVKEEFGVLFDTTNNIAEMTALIQALKTVKRKYIPITVISDSQYVVKGAKEWMHNWAKNGWKNSKKKEIENKDLWIELYLLTAGFDQIEFIHCDGHADNEGNNRVDFLCNKSIDDYLEFCKTDKIFV